MHFHPLMKYNRILHITDKCHVHIVVCKRRGLSAQVTHALRFRGGGGQTAVVSLSICTCYILLCKIYLNKKIFTLLTQYKYQR